MKHLASLHVKQGDQVVVIAGAAKGQQGAVLRTFPRTGRIVIEACSPAKAGRKRADSHGSFFHPFLKCARSCGGREKGQESWKRNT